MRKALLIVIIFISIDTNGQTYQRLIRPNIYWEQFNWGAAICNLTSGSRIHLGGDTIVNNVTYSKVYESPIFALNQIGAFCPPFGVDTSISYLNPIIAIREDTLSQRVYIFQFSNLTEYLLFDFNLQPGDTFFSPYTTGGVPFLIDSVQMITTYDGVDRRIYYCNQPFNPTLKYLIEGIGSSSGVYGSMFDAIGAGTSLTCVLDQNLSLLPPVYPFGISTCSQIVGIDESSWKFNVYLRPNPSNGLVTIEHSYPKGCTFNVYEPNGKIIYSKYSELKSVLLDLSIYNPGIYFVEIADQNQRIYLNKIVIVRN